MPFLEDDGRYVTREEIEDLRQSLLVYGDQQTIQVDQTPGGQVVRSTQVISVDQDAIPDPGTSTLEHPFKARATGVTQYDYTIGLGRGESFYVPIDIINIFDVEESKAYQIIKGSVENISVGFPDRIICYRISRSATGLQPWTAVLEAHTVTDFATLMENSEQTIYVPIARTLTGGGVGQLQFSDIRVWTKPFHASFSAYSYNGGVVISDGVVRISSGVSANVSGVTVPNGTSAAWVKIDSAPDASPSVTTTVQTGNFPGYESLSGGTLTRRILLGRFGAGGEWIPAHIGDINLGTVYQPSIPSQAQYINAQSYLMPAGITSTVGPGKDLFFDGHSLGVRIHGGEFEKVNDNGTLQLGGATVSSNQLIVTGASKSGNNLILTVISRELDTDKGLTQELNDTVQADIVIPIDGTAAAVNVIPGSGANVAEAPVGTFKVSSLLSAIGDGIDASPGADGFPNQVALNYPEIWSKVLAGTNISLVQSGDNLTISSTTPIPNYTFVPGVGIDITEAPVDTFTFSVDFPAVWANVNAIDGIVKGVTGDVMTLSADLDYLNTNLEVVATVETKRSVEQDVDLKVQLVGDVDTPVDYAVYSYIADNFGRGWNYIGDLLDDSDSILKNVAPDFPAAFDVRLSPASSLEIGDTDPDKGLQLQNDELEPDDYSMYGYITSFGAKQYYNVQEFFDSSASIAASGAPDSLMQFDVTPSPASSITVNTGIGVEGVELQNDEASPTAWKMYGTNGTPAKGYQQAETITVITGVQLDASNNLQIKTQQVRVFDKQTESSWTTVTGWTTTDCTP